MLSSRRLRKFQDEGGRGGLCPFPVPSQGLSLTDGHQAACLGSRPHTHGGSFLLHVVLAAPSVLRCMNAPLVVLGAQHFHILSRLPISQPGGVASVSTGAQHAPLLATPTLALCCFLSPCLGSNPPLCVSSGLPFIEAHSISPSKTQLGHPLLGEASAEQPASPARPHASPGVF